MTIAPLNRSARGWLALSFCLLFGAACTSHATPPEITLDITQAPDAGAFADKSRALVVEWYPRINTILFGDSAALPYAEIPIIFERTLPYAGVAAYVNGNAIHVSASYIVVMPDDFRAMMIHELTHIVQHYPGGQKDASWVVEGIADYVRHKYYEKDIEATLRLNADGSLRGYTKTAPYFYDLQRRAASLNGDGYLKSYTVASTFLYWLETRKNKDVVRELGTALRAGRYSGALFEKICGQPLPALWQAFVDEGKAGAGAAPPVIAQ